MSNLRLTLKQALDGLPDPAKTHHILESCLTKDAVFHAAHPINQAVGTEAIEQKIYQPLHHAMPGYQRRDELFMMGQSQTGSGDWMAAMGHYVGRFREPLFGIPASDKLVFLRYGEFYRLTDGRIAEARIMFDFVDLMRQAGHVPHPDLPLIHALGTEMLFPAPATHDGIILADPDLNLSHCSVNLVEAMLADLKAYDPQSFQSANQTGDGGYWHENMLWYGPAGIGSNVTYPGFDKDHRIAFLQAFPDRVGGNHFARFGDGNYVASGGWPSINATHKGDYLGIKATDRPITMRVMDFWRCAGTGPSTYQIMENWVFIDMPDLYRQLGIELFG